VGNSTHAALKLRIFLRQSVAPSAAAHVSSQFIQNFSTKHRNMIGDRYLCVRLQLFKVVTNNGGTTDAISLINYECKSLSWNKDRHLLQIMEVISCDKDRDSCQEKFAKGFDYLHNKKSRAGRQTHR
jgi:hypothetical protein